MIAALRELGIHQRGSIALEHIDVSVSDVAEAAEARVRGYGSDAAVWEDVDARWRDESVFTAGYLALIVIASVITAVGLVEDAPILIVGAMVVGPEFGPIAGLSLTQAKAGALIGVLISVTTIPAVAAIGVASALGNWQDARAAAVQLGLNVAALIIAGVLTLWVQREAWERVHATAARSVRRSS